MGGGGGRGSSRDDITRLEELARESLRNGEAEGKRNVFISFVEEDLQEVNLLRAQAKNENSELEFNDWSLREPFDSKKAEYIKRGISGRIQHSSVTMVYISENTADSRWVNWEINESIRLGKGVIAVHKGISAPKKIPKALEENNIPVIPWTHEGISAAIEQAANSE